MKRSDAMRVRVRRETGKWEVNAAVDFRLAAPDDAAQVSLMSVYRLDRRLIRVSGPDSVSFLQGLLTQNVEGLTGLRYGALLSPQGKIVADMLLWAHGGAIVMETHQRRGDELLRRLNLYKLRANVTIEDASDLGVLFSPEAFEGARADPRMPNGALGWRKLAARGEVGRHPSGEGEFLRLRLREGVPDLAMDAESEEIFAGEALMEELHGVDFQKGCFVGQENVSRMKRRATTRRKFCRIAFDEGEGLEALAPIRAGDAEIGAIRATTGGQGIALLRLDRALDARERGERLIAAGREIRLDPPPWLILPQRQAGAAPGDD
jgi:folate-binding protein YgfZ